MISPGNPPYDNPAIERGERTCDRCAQGGTDWEVVDEAYICADCRAEIAEVEAPRQQLRGAVEEIAALRDALIPFTFIGRSSVEPLGLAEEYDHARALLGLE